MHESKIIGKRIVARSKFFGCIWVIEAQHELLEWRVISEKACKVRSGYKTNGKRFYWGSEYEPNTSREVCQTAIHARILSKEPLGEMIKKAQFIQRALKKESREKS